MGKVLVVAESDPRGISGIQGMIKTLTAHGEDSVSIETALTFSAKDTFEVHPMNEFFINKQVEQVMDEDVSVVVIGYIRHPGDVELIMEMIRTYFPQAFVIYSPVTRLKASDILPLDAIHALRKDIFLNANLCVMNIPETEALTGQEIETLESMKKAAEMVITLGCRSALIIGGTQLTGHSFHDVLVTEIDFDVFVSPKVEFVNDYGMSYIISAAIAANKNNRLSINESAEKAREYLNKTMGIPEGGTKEAQQKAG